jgi:hypothetical protein
VVDAVVSHHLDGFRSGVARFNELLAQRLAVPLVGIAELGATPAARPLLSFKVRELDPGSAASVERWLDAHATWEVFLHEYAGDPLEERLVRGAARVLAGNHEILEQVASATDRAEVVWTPGLVLDRRDLPDDGLSVFTFGMAHKIRTDMFRRLKTLLDALGRPYTVFVSAANHETASLRDSEAVFAEMHDLFPDSLYFLGNLSDVAIHDRLRRATYFASFFPGGVRANNTSVATAMELGAVVVTNLDAYSPPELVHGENVVDVERCDALPTDPEALRRIGERAAETAAGRTWDALVERIGS